MKIKFEIEDKTYRVIMTPETGIETDILTQMAAGTEKGMRVTFGLTGANQSFALQIVENGK